MYAFNCYEGFPPVLVRIEVEKQTVWMWSEEGTQQGCPLAMALFGIATRPLLDKMREPSPPGPGASSSTSSAAAAETSRKARSS